jgi:hypothetical protein
MGNSKPAAAGTAPKRQLTRVRSVHASRRRFSADPRGAHVRTPIRPPHNRGPRSHARFRRLWSVCSLGPDWRLKPDRPDGRVR